MLATIAIVVALVSAFSIATVVFLDERGTSGLTSELSQRSGSHLALRATFDRASDAEAQDAAVRAAIDRTFAETGVGFTTIRALEAEVYVTLVAADGTAQSNPSTASTFPDFAEHAVFATGKAPSGDREVAIPVDAAALLGATVGDELLINELPFTVSGTWRAQDPLDPRWYADPRVVTGGVDDDRLGPFAVDESAWDRMSSPPIASWTIVPASSADITATNFSAIRSAWADAQADWRGSVPEYESMAVENRFSRTLDEFAQRITGLRAIEPVVFVLMVGSALVGLSQLVQLLVATRERESVLFWARGQSPAAVARRLTAEVAVSALIGASLGVAIVVGLAIALAQGAGLLAVRPIAFVVPALAVGGAAVLAAISAGRSAVAISTPRRGGRGTGRVARVAVPGVVALVTIAAAVAVWQLRLYGSPLIATATGAVTIDPLAVAAPTAALVAVVLIGLAVFPAIVTASARRATPTGVRGHLASRTLARDTRRVVAPLVVVALAVGSATIAASFSASWSSTFSQAAQLYAGADVRVSSRFAAITPDQLEAVARTDGVTAVAPLDVQTLSVGMIRGTTLAAAPEAVRTLATTADGTFDPADAAVAIALTQTGPAIPPGTSAFTVRVEALGFVETPVLVAWVADPLGRLHTLPFADPIEEPDGVLVYTAEPDGLEGAVVSFDVDLPSQEVDDPPSWRLLEFAMSDGDTETVVALDQFWVVDTLSQQLAPPTPFPDGDGFELDWPLGFVRMTASFNGTVFDDVAPPVLISSGLATDLGLAVGDSLSFAVRESQERLNGVIAGIVTTIPGSRTDQALLMDVALTQHLRLRTDRVPAATTDLSIAADDPERARHDLRAVLPADTRIDTSTDAVGREVLGAASLALWAAAVNCLLIAIVALASAARSRVRWGHAEIGSLRAIGLSSRDQSSIVIRELGVVLGAAAVIGMLAGATVSALTVPQLARAAVDRAYLSGVTVLEVDWVGLAVLLGLLALGVAVILLDLNRRVRALAATSLPGEAHS
jgi:ABC-type lipoprotein release transport system permease subunit